ncbi:MAG: DUF2961 domain-containing protein [Fibrobacteria bacterium]|nr:DUF2961 domain-containing protein [Fibrobacteria bacterium]
MHQLFLSRVTLMSIMLLAGLIPWNLAATPNGGAAMLALDSLPYLNSGVTSGQQSSYSRSGGNNDHSHYLYKENGENVMLDLKGPGVVYAIWNAAFDTASDRIRAYFDDETEPRIDIPMGKFFRGNDSPFLNPLNVTEKTSAAACVSYHPIPFEKSIKMVSVSAAKAQYYHASYHTFMPGTKVESWTGKEDLSAVYAQWKAKGKDPKPMVVAETVKETADVPANQTVTLFNKKGPGQLVSLRILVPGLWPDFKSNNALDIYANVKIKVFYNGSTEAGVDATLGDFFLIGRSAPSLKPQSQMLGIDSSDYFYCYFPMPYETSCRVELVSERASVTEGVSWEIKHTPFTASFDNVGYFKTRANHENHGADGTDILLIEESGSGKLVGVVESRQTSNLQTLEGDERIYVDGNRSPAWYGTGTEDFYHGAWYFGWMYNNWQPLAFTQPMQGVPSYSSKPERITMYRFMTHDAITFRTGIYASIEHGGSNDIATEAWTVVFYYHKPEPSMVLTDSVNVGDNASETSHAFTVENLVSSDNVKSIFEGAFGGVQISHAGKYGKGKTSFNTSILPSNNGVIIRRMYDQKEVLQHAEVSVNGEGAGTWYTAGGNAYFRWREDEFMIPASITSGKSSLQIEITHKEGTPDWSSFRYQVFSLTDTSKTVGVEKQHTAQTISSAEAVAVALYSIQGKLLHRTGIQPGKSVESVFAGFRSSLPMGVYVGRVLGKNRVLEMRKVSVLN